MSNNPYQAPSTYVDAPIAEIVDERKLPNNGRVLLKWLVICVVSAAPSFVWGATIGDLRLEAIVGMLMGILTFTFAYTFFELTPFAQRWLRDPFIKRTAKIGYGTRLGMSILFPIGLSMDMVVGMLALATSTTLFGQDSIAPTRIGEAATGPSFLWFFATTIVQGIYLNIILFVYMLVVYALVRAFSKPKV